MWELKGSYIVLLIAICITVVSGNAPSICDDIPDACVPASDLGSCKCALVLTEDASLDKRAIRQLILSPTAARLIRPLVPQSNQPILTDMPPEIGRTAAKTFFKIALIPRESLNAFVTFYSEKCVNEEDSLFVYSLRGLSRTIGCSVEKPCELKMENRVKTPTPPVPVPFNIDAKMRNPHKYNPEKHREKYGDNQLPLKFYSFYGKMADNYLGMTLVSFAYTKSVVKTMRLTQEPYQNCRTVGLLLGKRQKCATEYRDVYAKYEESVEKRFLAKVASDANKKVVWKEYTLLNQQNIEDLDDTFCPAHLP
uniref:Uncharacterized protein n=1 Tax=Plectus sambesii TaxID=2011161 RepID=A0A914UIZ0_9BILA